jgi:hypothetical protein
LFLWVVCRVLLWVVGLGSSGVLLVSLGLLWVHLGALSYTFCIIGCVPFKFALFDIYSTDL